MGEPEAKFDDPYFSTTWEDGEPHKPTIHANVNDHIGLTQDTNRLLGRTEPDRGPVRHIEVLEPLILEDNQLSFDASEIEQAIADEAVARTAAISAEASSRTTAIATAKSEVVDGEVLSLGTWLADGGAFTNVGGVLTFTENSSNVGHDLNNYTGITPNPAGHYFVEYEVKDGGAGTRYLTWYVAEYTSFNDGITEYGSFNGSDSKYFMWQNGINAKVQIEGREIKASTDGYTKHRLWFRITEDFPIVFYFILATTNNGATGAYTGNGVHQLFIRNFVWKKVPLGPPAYLATDLARVIPSYTYATRPTNPQVGQRIVISDANVNTFRASVTGSGANIVQAWWNGSNWLVMG